MRRTTVTLGAREVDVLLSLAGRGYDEIETEHSDDEETWHDRRVADAVLRKLARAYRATADQRETP